MRIKRLLLALLLSLLVGKSFAISFKVDGISYETNADTAMIKGYSEIPENGELTLASTVSYGGKDYRVTTVRQSAFLSCTDIKKLTVPASIKYIQSSAFENCVNLIELILESGNERLDCEGDAFKNSAIITAFVGRNLKNTIFRDNTVLEKVKFADGIKMIPYNCFSGCTNLYTVELSKVEDILNSAFSDCKSLKALDLSSVVSIKSDVFCGCQNLKNVTFRKVQYIYP